MTFHRGLIRVTTLAIVTIVAPPPHSRSSRSPPRAAHRRRPGSRRDRPRRRLSQARAAAARQLDRIPRLRRRRHRALHARAAQLRRARRRSDRQASARLSSRPRTRQNLHRLAANDGPLRRRAEEGHAAHPPQRAVARSAPDQRRPAQRRLVLSRARAATTATRSSPCSPSTMPSASASKSAARPGSSPPTTGASTQNDDGSWGYVPGDSGTGSMTCAGIGGLAVSIGRAGIGRRRRRKRPRHLLPPARQTTTSSTAPSTGSASSFSVNHNPRPAGGGQSCLYYYLYGLERAGRLTAHRFIGKHDWYREGAELLIREQDSLSHYWKGNWYAERDPHISTAMALLFLVQGPPARSSWPSSSTAKATIGTSIAATPPISPSTPKKPGASASPGK